MCFYYLYAKFDFLDVLLLTILINLKNKYDIILLYRKISMPVGSI